MAVLQFGLGAPQLDVAMTLRFFRNDYLIAPHVHFGRILNLSSRHCRMFKTNNFLNSFRSSAYITCCQLFREKLH